MVEAPASAAVDGALLLTSSDPWSAFIPNMDGSNSSSSIAVLRALDLVSVNGTLTQGSCKMGQLSTKGGTERVNEARTLGAPALTRVIGMRDLVK